MALPKDEGRTSRTPLIEVTVTHEHGPAPSSRQLSEAVEIITRNHVYVLDSGLRCVRVLTASTREPVTDSGFVDARLVGGQVNTDSTTELSYPFPRPGAVAVFEAHKGKARHFHTTSPVQRVLVKLSIVTVTRTRAIPTWEEISRALHRDED